MIQGIGESREANKVGAISKGRGEGGAEGGGVIMEAAAFDVATSGHVNAARLVGSHLGAAESWGRHVCLFTLHF